MAFTPYGELEDDRIPQLQLLADKPPERPAAAPTPEAKPGSWAQAAQMLQQYNQARPKSAPRFTMPAPEAKPEHNTGGMLWAMALNLLGNQGRDIGAIAMADAQARNKELADWRARNSPDAMLDRQAKIQRLNDADNDAREKDFQHQVTLAKMVGEDAERAATGERWQKSFDQTAQFHGDTEKRLQQFHTDDLAHQATQEQLQRDQMAQAAELARQQRALGWAGLKQNDAHFATSQANEMERARLELAQKQAAAAAAAAKEERDRAQHNTERQEDMTHNLSKETEDIRRMIPDLNRAQLIQEKYKGTGDTPGLGVLEGGDPGLIRKGLVNLIDAATMKGGSERRADANTMRSAIENIATFDVSLLSGSAHSKAEEAKSLLRAGGGPVTEERAQAALKAMREALELDARSRGAANPEAMRSVLAPYGWSGVMNDPQTAGGTGIPGLTRVVR